MSQHVLISSRVTFQPAVINNICITQPGDPGDSVVKSLPAVQKTWVPPCPGREDPWSGNWQPLQCSCLGVPWTEGPGGLPSAGRKESDTTEYSTAAEAYSAIICINLFLQIIYFV